MFDCESSAAYQANVWLSFRRPPLRPLVSSEVGLTPKFVPAPELEQRQNPLCTSRKLDVNTRWTGRVNCNALLGGA